jgi:hypothetical protein
VSSVVEDVLDMDSSDGRLYDTYWPLDARKNCTWSAMAFPVGAISKQRQIEEAQSGVYFLAHRNHQMELSGTQYLYEARCGLIIPTD